MNSTNGKLYVVATPIGNLEDFSVRGQTTLSKVSWIACEDTRHSKKLLSSFGISTPCHSLHQFNEKKQLDKFIQRLLQGESGAVISDAGTPVISDPGFHLVQAAHEHHIDVITIPGPCALVTALSGLAIQEGPFYFEGFLPSKSSSRKKRLKELGSRTEQLIFYEAPHRISELFNDLLECYGKDRLAGIGREITKRYESYYRGRLEELVQQLAEEKIPALGEFVVVVSGAAEEMSLDMMQHEKLIQCLLAHLPINKVAKITSELTSLDRKQSYQLALSLQTKE